MRIRTVVHVTAVTALLVGVVGTFQGPGAQAQALSTFTLRARADSVGVQAIAENAPVVSIGGGEVAFVTPASVQAELDSLGGSRAFASSPYPGDLIVSLPDTASGLFGGVNFPVPGYPFYVSSEYPVREKQSEEAGPYAMLAQSDQNSSTAESRIGLSTAAPKVVSITSNAHVENDEEAGRAVATASTEIAPFSVSDVLKIGNIRTTARAEYDPSNPDAKPSFESSISVGTVTVAGMEVGLTDEGLVAAGDQLLPVDLTDETDVLTEAGIQIELVPEQRTDTSLTSAGVRITYKREFPNLGPTTVRLVLGQTTVTADPGNAFGPPEPPPDVEVAPVSPPSSDSGTGGEVADVSVDTATPQASVPEPAAPTGSPAASAPSPSVAPPASAQAPAASPPPVAGAAMRLPGADLRSLYPILAAGGMLALVISRLTSWHALRRRMSVNTA